MAARARARPSAEKELSQPPPLPPHRPQAHAGLLTFGVMAVTVAGLTFLYGLVVCVLAQRLSLRLQQRPWVGRALQKLGGGLLVAFGLKLVLSK